MSTWTFADGSQITSGANVVGDQTIAYILRDDFNRLRANQRAQRSVELGMMPSGLFVFGWDDLRTSDWVLNVYLGKISKTFGVAFTTDYVPKEEDLPQKARDFFAYQARLKANEALRKPDPSGDVVAN